MLPDSVREPLMRAAVIIAAIAGLAVMLIGPFMAMLGTFGLGLTPEQVDAITTFLQAVVAALGAYGVAKAVRNQVTPVAAPVLPEGTPVGIEDTDETAIVRSIGLEIHDAPQG